jgi:hypothetical protein
MSFAGWNQDTQKLEAQSQNPLQKAKPRNRGPLLALSATGMFALLWLSRRTFPDRHHLPPDFNGRLHALAPSFAVFAAALFCTFTTIILWKGWESASAARRAAENGEASSARTNLSKRARLYFVAAYVLAGSAMMCIP